MKLNYCFHSVLLFLIVQNFDSTNSEEEPGTCSKGDKDCPPPPQAKKCALTPQSYEGPFFLPNQLVRSDIREGRPGVPLTINFIIRDPDCKVVKNVELHLWHADAFGEYSAYSGYYPLGDPNAKKIHFPHSEPTETATFLRGIQPTDADGKAKFTTIYPGWYSGRALHLHFKVTDNGRERYSGEIYFPDDLSNQVFQTKPYSERSGKRKLNYEDRQFIEDHGEELVMTPKGSISEGFEGNMEIVIH